MKLFDGRNHPSAATVKADGLDGAMLYLGTPSSGKDLTAQQYRDYKAHGLFTAVGFEHVVDDWRGGAAAGRRNGAAFLADAKAKGVDHADPFWVVGADQHVANADLPTVVAYVRAYVATVRAAGWRGPSGGYGFPEVTTALHNAGVCDWYWGAGSRTAQPSFINVWQRNDRTILVGGSADDEDDGLIPIPRAPLEDDDMALRDKLPPIVMSDGQEHDLTVGDVLRGLAQLIPGDRSQDANTTAHPSGQYRDRIVSIANIDANVAKIAGALPANQATLVALLNEHTSGTATVSRADLEAAFRAVLGDGWDVTITPKAAAQ